MTESSGPNTPPDIADLNMQYDPGTGFWVVPTDGAGAVVITGSVSDATNFGGDYVVELWDTNETLVATTNVDDDLTFAIGLTFSGELPGERQYKIRAIENLGSAALFGPWHDVAIQVGQITIAAERPEIIWPEGNAVVTVVADATRGERANFSIKWNIEGANATHRSLNYTGAATDDDSIGFSVSEDMYFQSVITEASFAMHRGRDYNDIKTNDVSEWWLIENQNLSREQYLALPHETKIAILNEYKDWYNARITARNSEVNFTAVYEYAAGDFSGHNWEDSIDDQQGNNTDRRTLPGDYSMGGYGFPPNVDRMSERWSLSHSKNAPANWAISPKSTLTLQFSFHSEDDTSGFQSDARSGTLTVTIDDRNESRTFTVPVVMQFA